jgi:hypothetical protein
VTNSASVPRSTADDFDHLDTPMLQPGDRDLRGVYRRAVSRNGIRQCGHLADFATAPLPGPSSPGVILGHGAVTESACRD